ncbi:MAG: hypothetical protein ABS76_17980 [Pelagibacterium sp. SCN 64-44]|nr:MAG: hypothetical protein ABS76_17980 [Pelagibacterium sp. SCN 64-44]
MGGCVPASGLSPAPADFIRSRLALEPLPFRPDISLYRPTPRSGLHAWLAAGGRDGAAPYWAYAWAGGAALALYLRDHPECVAGRSVLDFGAGSGLVAIAAARAGAAAVFAVEPDPVGRVAARLNAEANQVTLTLIDAMAGTDIVLAGDVFYDPAIAARTLPLLQEALASGAEVLVGDPFRRDLPHAAIQQIAEYSVPDMGSETPVPAGIFALHP